MNALSDYTKNLFEENYEFSSFQKAALEKLSSAPLLNPKNEDFKYLNLQSDLKPFYKPKSLSDSSKTKYFSSISEKLNLFDGLILGDSAKNLGSYISVYNIGEKFPEAFSNSNFFKEENQSPLRLLSDATFSQLIFIDVPAGEKYSLEISHIISDSVVNNQSQDQLPFSASRIFVRVGKGAELNLVEVSSSSEQYTGFSNKLIEFLIDEDADVNHLRLQLEGRECLHTSGIYVNQIGRSNFKTIALNFGAKVARNEIYCELPAEGSQAWLIGANVLNANQQVDNFTVIKHIAESCESHELYKGMYGGTSKGNFAGTIVVEKSAQKTNAYQSNSSLLCSPDAESNSRPQLKIWADDVKCSHGATIGELDEEALFYLKARGIPADLAKVILSRAYVSEVLGHIFDPSLKVAVEEILQNKLQELI